MNSTIACPTCGQSNPAGTLFCVKCHARFPGADETPTIASRSFSSLDDTTLGGGTPAPIMERGTKLAGGRYEILEILGQGAMGAVYKARDHELDRWVAIKVIQPELANSRAILKRFKQELILARQVTHKNVVRIFDIGETDGMKFITMEYIAGSDLKSLIVERDKMPAEEAVDIIRQICLALEAAHGEGVVHRDLKPQNIMIEQTGRVVVMDFGIAHSKDLPGATMTGALVGTPEYMSPEQAKGEKTDTRADIFAVGIIFYELLTGRVPFRAGTLVETMYKRTRERAIPPVELDQTIPVQANRVIMKCLETAPENRYQNVKEILQDLATFDPRKTVGALDRVRFAVARRRKVVAVGVAVLLVLVVAGLAGFLLRDRLAPEPAAVHPNVSVFVADFSNHTGELVFDGTLEPVIKITLEGAGFITAYDRTQARNLGLPPIADKLDEPGARQIAIGQGLNVVVSGSLERQGAIYSLSMKATQAVTGNTIRTAQETAPKKEDVLLAATKLAGILRKALGDDAPESALRFAGETFTATSLEAIHEYATAVEALGNAKYEDALRSFSKAANMDQKFGMAYVGMAAASRNLGQQQDAEKYVKLALEHVDGMTERERYRTRASYYNILGDQRKCIEEYGTLISKFPADVAAHNNLAYCWTQLRNMTRALEEMRAAAAILPKRLIYRWNLSLYASYGSDFMTGEREARALQSLDSSSPLGLSALAFAQMGQGQSMQAAATYQELEKIGKVNASDGRAGQADVAIYEGRFGEAIHTLEQGAADDLTAKYPDKAASKFAALAYTRLLLNQKDPAMAAAERALMASKIVKIRFLAGRIFALLGDTARAQMLAAGLGSELQIEPQAYAKLIEGNIALQKEDARGAIKAFSEANNLLDTWIGRFDLGRAYLAAEAFTEADSEFDRCIKRRGEALALFFDESPTYSYFPPVYYYQGRAREGLKSTGFAEFYRNYIAIRGKAGEDPALAEVRRRAGL
jgi:tetratricopeptide (TPR) repeat protein/tRNA A-37 threonylcarbamoyl transferase component Bud32